MKKYFTLITLTIIFGKINAQINGNTKALAKEFSKEVALYQSKKYIITNVLTPSNVPLQFELIPLAAANSGELTTLFYRSSMQKKEGMILGFYGTRFNENGTVYTGFDFKNLNKEQAEIFLNKIENAIDENIDYLHDENDNNNICFRFEDIDVVIWGKIGSYVIRLFWHEFDSEWERSAFERSKRRFSKNLK